MTEEKKDISWRAYLVYFIVCLFGLIILGKAAYIQIAEGNELEELVKQQTLIERNIEAVRGNILSYDGSLLATSIPIYEVRFDPNVEALSDQEFYGKVDSLALLLSNLFGDKSQYAYKNEMIKARKEGDRFHLVKRNVKYNQLKAMKRFPIFRKGKYKGGFIYLQRNRRERPFQILAARTIGYEREGVAPVGLEGAYSDILAGIDGKRLMQKLAGGVWMPVSDENEIEPQDGYDIYTSIDVNIQDVAENALMKQLEEQQADHGCVVLMEVETGAIKAIANLKRSTNGRYYESYNYAIGESTEPGSTFKLPALIAAIEDGYVDMDDIIDCEDGSKRFYDRIMYDSKEDGWGKISVQRVLEVSSNIGMAKIINQAYSSDPQKFIDHLDKMNLRDPLDIKIAGEGKPYIKNTSADSWSGITLAWMAHGYEVQQTPLQILTFYNAVANDGKMVKPKFIEKIANGRKTIKIVETEVINPQICSIETIKKVQKALEGVVQNGTASNLSSADYKIAGKTGTAQIANKNYGYNYQSNTSYQASFVGYFPADNPKYSCIVVVNAPSQNVYYGNLVAGPIFKEVADKVYANSLKMHNEMQRQKNYANSRIPYSKSGYGKNIQEIFAKIGVPTKINQDVGQWITTTTLDTLVSISNRKLVDNLMPNVVGMGLRDAVFLLENKGLRVEPIGRGMVKKQSILPGSRIEEGKKITIHLS